MGILRFVRQFLIAWILINEYGCIIKGGFVRDWIVAGNDFFPKGTKFNDLGNNRREFKDPKIAPNDLDVMLPIDPKEQDKLFFD